MLNLGVVRENRIRNQLITGVGMASFVYKMRKYRLRLLRCMENMSICMEINVVTKKGQKKRWVDVIE